MRTFCIITLLSVTISCWPQMPELKSPSSSTICDQLDISSDGRYIVIVADFISLLDVNTGKELKVYNYRANSLSFAPDGRSIAAGGAAIRILDTKSGKILRTITDKATIYSARFSPDGKTIAGFTGNNIKLWNVSTGQLIRTFINGPKSIPSGKLRFTPDGKFLVSSDQSDGNWVDSKWTYTRKGYFNIWNVSTGAMVKSFPVSAFGAYDYDISSDGTEIVSVSGKESIKIWNLNTGELKKEISMTDPSRNDFELVCFSPDAKKIITGLVSQIKIWDVETANLVSDFVNETQVAVMMPMLKTNNFITGSLYNGVKIWDANTHKVVQGFDRKTNRIEKFAMSENGNYFLPLLFNKHFRLCDSTFKNITSFRNSYYQSYAGICCPADSKAIITCGGTSVYFWDRSTGNVIKSYDNILDNQKRKVISKDGKYLIEFFRADHRFKYYALEDGRVLGDVSPKTGWEPDIYSMCFSPDNKYFAAGMELSQDLQTGRILGETEMKRVVGIWEMSSGRQIIMFPTNHPVGIIQDMCFSADSRYIFTNGNNDEIICQWDLKGNLVKTFPGRISDLSENGKYLLAGSWSKKELYLYDIAAGLLKQKFLEGGAYGSNVAYISNDCKYVYSSEGHSIRTWDVSTGKLLFSNYLMGVTDWVTISPDGFFDGTPDGLKELYYVNGLEIVPLESTFEQFFTPNLAARLMAGEKIQSAVNLSQLKPAPEVKIISPENNSESPGSEITITVLAKDNGGGIDEIQLFQNGKLIETTQRGFKVVSAENTQNFKVTLVDGLNTFKATAFNSQRTEAIPAIIRVTYAGQTASNNLYLLIIGINNYKNPVNKLNYALADAGSFKSAIEEGSGDIFGKINVTYLQDSEVTRQGIIDALDAVKSRIKPEDVFIFYYAGHGVMSEEARSKFYIIPYDVIQLYGDNESLKKSAVSSEEFQEISREIKAQKQLYILDACQSGGMVEMLASRGSAEQKAIAQLARSTGTYWLTASNSRQFASEFSALGHGLFTYAILQGLSGQADGVPDKKITVEELSAYIKNTLPELSVRYKGEAQYPNSYGYGNDFPIVIIK